RWSSDAHVQNETGRRRGDRGVSEVAEVKQLFLLLAAISALIAQDAGSVLLVVNDSSLFSGRIGEYYVRKRSIPIDNVCHLKVDIAEAIARDVYEKSIEAPIAA